MITLYDLLNNLMEDNNSDFTEEGFCNALSDSDISQLRDFMNNFDFNNANTLKAIADLTFSLFRYKDCDYMTLWRDFDFCDMTLKAMPTAYGDAFNDDSYIIAYRLADDDIRYYAFTI